MRLSGFFVQISLFFFINVISYPQYSNFKINRGIMKKVILSAILAFGFVSPVLAADTTATDVAAPTAVDTTAADSAATTTTTDATATTTTTATN